MPRKPAPGEHVMTGAERMARLRSRKAEQLAGLRRTLEQIAVAPSLAEARRLARVALALVGDSAG